MAGEMSKSAGAGGGEYGSSASSHNAKRCQAPRVTSACVQLKRKAPAQPSQGVAQAHRANPNRAWTLRDK
jgi:hypothetical protein